jgi:hypothetical protein
MKPFYCHLNKFLFHPIKTRSVPYIHASESLRLFVQCPDRVQLFLPNSLLLENENVTGVAISRENNYFLEKEDNFVIGESREAPINHQFRGFQKLNINYIHSSILMILNELKMNQFKFYSIFERLFIGESVGGRK